MKLALNIRNLFVDGKRFDIEKHAKDFTSVEKDFSGNTIVELEYTYMSSRSIHHGSVSI